MKKFFVYDRKDNKHGFKSYVEALEFAGEIVPRDGTHICVFNSNAKRS